MTRKTPKISSSTLQRDSLLKSFVADCSATVLTGELLLCGTLLLAALMVTLVTSRDAILSELADITSTVDSTNQSVQYFGTSSPSAATPGVGFADQSDGDFSNRSGNVAACIELAMTSKGGDGDVPDIESTTYRLVMTRGTSQWTGAASFLNGIYSVSNFWPGTYSQVGSLVTITFDALCCGWDSGTAILDASDPAALNGTATWINSISGFIWTAVYELFAL